MSSSDAVATQRWRLDLAYEGRGFSGFAEQPGRATVVGALRENLARTLRLDEAPSIVGAGRTDAGVPAFAQVVHVDLPTPLFATARGPEAARLVRSLNKQLAGRVVVLRALAVDAAFHARFSAQWRAYRYLVLESAAPALDLSSAWSWSVVGPLDLDAMNRVAGQLLGEHDFRAFCERPKDIAPGSPLVRVVLAARWERRADEWSLSPLNAPALRLSIRATSFCHRMVRCLASTMVAIGQGRLDEATLSERLASGERANLPAPAPAAGLCLVGVGYEELVGGPSGFVG